MALWFRAELYNSHHCFLTYLQWLKLHFLPLNSSYCRLKTPVFLTIFLVKFVFRVGFGRTKGDNFVICLDCLTRCVSLTKLTTYDEVRKLVIA